MHAACVQQCLHIEASGNKVEHLDGKHDVDGSNDVVVLGVDCASPVNHGVGGAPLLPKVHHCIRLEASDNILQELPVTHIPNLQVNVIAGNLSPPADDGEGD